MRPTFKSKLISSSSTISASPSLLSSLSTSFSHFLFSVFSFSFSFLRFCSSFLSSSPSFSFSISFSSFFYLILFLWLFITTFFPFYIPPFTAYALMDVHTISPKENDVFILPLRPSTINYHYLLGEGTRLLLALPMNSKTLLRPPFYLSDPIIQHFWIRIHPIHSEAQVSTYYFKLSSPDVHALDFVVQTYGYDPSRTNHTNFPLQSNCLPPCEKYLRVTCFTNSYSYEPFTKNIIVIVEEEKLIFNLLAPSILENLICSLFAAFLALYFIYPKLSFAFDQIHFICASPSTPTPTPATSSSSSSSSFSSRSLSLALSTSEPLLNPMDSQSTTSPTTPTTTTPTPTSSSFSSSFHPSSHSTTSFSSSSTSFSSSPSSSNPSTSSKLQLRSFSLNNAVRPNKNYLEE